MEWIYFAIPSTVTIIGFIITIYLNNKSVKDEVKKVQSSIALSKITDVPFELAEMMSNITNGKFGLEEYSQIISRIIGYGSNDAVKILERMQQFMYVYYDENGVKDEKRKFDVIIYVSILISQIKLDLTSQVISPLSWIKIRIKDYEILKDTVIKRVNEIVKENTFNSLFIVEEKKMRSKSEVLEELEAFYGEYENTTVPGDYVYLRNTFKRLRDEVKEHCPKSPIFKRFSLTGRTIDDYKCPEIMEKTYELINTLKNC